MSNSGSASPLSFPAYSCLRLCIHKFFFDREGCILLGKSKYPWLIYARLGKSLSTTELYGVKIKSKSRKHRICFDHILVTKSLYSSLHIVQNHCTHINICTHHLLYITVPHRAVSCFTEECKRLKFLCINFKDSSVAQ